MRYSDLFVNEYGIRFADESNGGALGTSDGKLVESQGYVFSILDQSMIDACEGPAAASRHYSGFADVPVGAPIDLRSEIEQYADRTTLERRPSKSW